MAAKPKPKAKRGRGRPTTYSKVIAKKVCERIAAGESLREIYKTPGMPGPSTVIAWAMSDRDGFYEQYAHAIEMRAHLWAEQILDISDDGSNDWMERNDEDNPGYRHNGEHFQRSRLRVDSRKWMLSKMLPKFADRQEHIVSGSIDYNKISDEELDERIRKLSSS